jgi:hypothetical protein
MSVQSESPPSKSPVTQGRALPSYNADDAGRNKPPPSLSSGGGYVDPRQFSSGNGFGLGDDSHAADMLPTLQPATTKQYEAVGWRVFEYLLM